MKITVNKEDKHYYFEELDVGDVFKHNSTYYMKIAKVRSVPATMPKNVAQDCLELSLTNDYNVINLENWSFALFRNNEYVRVVDAELIISE